MPFSTTSARKPRVVVVGTGHGGLETVHALRNADVDVLLVDRNNYHKFQPLLYQVATAGLMPGHITQSARHIFQRQANADFRMAWIDGVDFEARTLHTLDGEPIPYDYLVLAPGASVAYYGVEGAREHAFPLKNVPDAVNLRSHLVACFEHADRSEALADDGSLTFVIVGGGPTGVELGGALAELFSRVFRKDFHHVDFDRVRIVLVERGGALLPGYEAGLQAYTLRELERRGVEVRLQTAVARVTETAVHLESGEVLPTRSCLWAAGVRANPLTERLGVALDPAGRILVDEHLRIPGHPEVFAVGDASLARDDRGLAYPQLAQVAIQQGRLAAANIVAQHEGRPMGVFRYKDLGMMATIGRNAAVVQFPSGRTMRGYPAWMAWLGVHLVKLVGFRNRTGVFFNWIYNYFTWDRGPRLLMTSTPQRDDLDPIDGELLAEREPLAQALRP